MREQDNEYGAYLGLIMGSDLKVTLLGTGHPSPRLDRFGPSTLIEAAGHKILIDCGRGTMQIAIQINTKTQEYEKLFLTHLHSHTTGIPDLWITAYVLCGVYFSNSK